MLDNETIRTILPYLKYAHGLFNILGLLLFLYQGWIGMKIRRRRKSGSPPEVTMVKRHRKLGPFLPLFVLFGFAGGIATVYLSRGGFYEYPIHFLNGLTISALAIAAFLVSRKIRGREAGVRTVHFLIGLMILSLYGLQAYLGIQMIY